MQSHVDMQIGAKTQGDRRRRILDGQGDYQEEEWSLKDLKKLPTWTIVAYNAYR